MNKQEQLFSTTPVARDRHHFYYNRRAMPGNLRNHELASTYMDTQTHRDYHAEHTGLTRRPHHAVTTSILGLLDAMHQEGVSDPVEVVKELSDMLGSMAATNGLEGRKSARQTEQLLTPQIPFLVEGRASYEG